jgi:hypothetical protein
MRDFCWCGRPKTKEIQGEPYCYKHFTPKKQIVRRPKYPGKSKTPFATKYLD